MKRVHLFMLNLIHASVGRYPLKHPTKQIARANQERFASHSSYRISLTSIQMEHEIVNSVHIDFRRAPLYTGIPNLDTLLTIVQEQGHDE